MDIESRANRLLYRYKLLKNKFKTKSNANLRALFSNSLFLLFAVSVLIPERMFWLDSSVAIGFGLEVFTLDLKCIVFTCYFLLFHFKHYLISFLHFVISVCITVCVNSTLSFLLCHVIVITTKKYILPIHFFAATAVAQNVVNRLRRMYQW